MSLRERSIFPAACSNRSGDFSADDKLWLAISRGHTLCSLPFAAAVRDAPQATTDGPKNTDVNLFVYDDAGKEVGKDVSPGPKCSVKVTPAKDGNYKFVITNAGGENTVIFNVKFLARSHESSLPRRL
jgi:hypothetical protein